MFFRQLHNVTEEISMHRIPYNFKPLHELIVETSIHQITIDDNSRYDNESSHQATPGVTHESAPRTKVNYSLTMSQITSLTSLRFTSTAPAER